jgi:hypothetical protein
VNKIKLSQLDNNEVEISLSPDTPIEMVNQLAKGLNARGLVEDLAKSTVSLRYFYKPQDTTNQKADQLIKSLEKMAGDDPYWSRESRSQTNLRNKINDRRAGTGLPSVTDKNIMQNKPPVVASPEASKPLGASVLPPNQNKLHSPSMSGTVNYKKSEHPENCSCRECKDTRKAMDIKKSERKLNWNDSDLDTVATNFARSISDKLVKGTEVGAQLDALKNGTRIKLQPTDQELFGHLVPTEDMLKGTQESHANKINDFFAEASKPIGNRFKSAEEEARYWDSIKVDGGSEEGPGY